MINPKKIVKQLISFAKREFREKKPFGVMLLRIINEKIISEGGPLKILSISPTSYVYYPVQS